MYCNALKSFKADYLRASQTGPHLDRATWPTVISLTLPANGIFASLSVLAVLLQPNSGRRASDAAQEIKFAMIGTILRD